MRSQRSQTVLAASVVLAGWLVAGSACSERSSNGREKDFLALPHIQAPPELIECAQKVDEYVSSKKSWSKGEYKIVLIQKGGPPTSFQVRHIDDYREPPKVGGGTSFLAEADCGTGKVLRELWYQ
jgi:hypothetical protein